MPPAKRETPSPMALLSAAASAAATAVLIRNVAGDVVPRQLQVCIWTKLSSFFSSRSSQIVITVHEFEGLYPNKLFNAAEIYLAAKISPTTLRFRASIPFKEERVVLAVDKNQLILDVFAGVEFSWKKVSDETDSTMRYGDECEERGRMSTQYFELSFDMKHRDMVLGSYFPHIESESSRLKREWKSLKIHMLTNYSGSRWVPASLNHPATFNTLAMEPEMKKMIMDDLDMFVNRKDFYTRVGKAWKRGYLLYGPPGTGKSSLIAAIANHLKFDIYDLELADLSHNSDLRNLLTTTANRSILVVEDIDCSVDLNSRKTRIRPALGPAMAMGHPPRKSHTAAKTQVTLSGLLNFIDGLWSSCGDERIIIFTTNHKERLDPALLRPGRMDLHIHMSYCTPCGFKMLASNYLGVAEHPLFAELKQLVATAKATPAEVGEQLMRSQDPNAALKGLLEFLKVKEEESDAKADEPEKEPEVSEIAEESEEDGFDF